MTFKENEDLEFTIKILQKTLIEVNDSYQIQLKVLLEEIDDRDQQIDSLNEKLDLLEQSRDKQMKELNSKISMQDRELALQRLRMDEAIKQYEKRSKQELKRINEANKIGLKLIELLEDYHWDDTYTSFTPSEILALKQAPPSLHNIDNKIVMWINSRANFNFATSSEAEKACFAEETDHMIRIIVDVIPDHPVISRLHRWAMDTFYDDPVLGFDVTK